MTAATAKTTTADTVDESAMRAVADAMRDAATTASEHAAQVRQSASEAGPKALEAISHAIYTGSYVLAYGIVYAAVFMAQSLPQENPAMADERPSTSSAPTERTGRAWFRRCRAAAREPSRGCERVHDRVETSAKPRSLLLFVANIGPGILVMQNICQKWIARRFSLTTETTTAADDAAMRSIADAIRDAAATASEHVDKGKEAVSETGPAGLRRRLRDSVHRPVAAPGEPGDERVGRWRPGPRRQ
jgi:hypothetical protein